MCSKKIGSKIYNTWYILWEFLKYEPSEKVSEKQSPNGAKILLRGMELKDTSDMLELTRFKHRFDCWQNHWKYVDGGFISYVINIHEARIFWLRAYEKGYLR